MPDKKDNDNTSLDRIRSDRGLARPSGFFARRTRELARRARDLKLTDDIEVVFPDQIIEAEVRETLGKPQGPITRRDLRGLSGLIGRRPIKSKNIANLSGLEHAVNLTWLDLDGNQISDISLLASLTNLAELSLYHNLISDVSPLASLTNLAELQLGRNQISDVSPLGSLTNLTRTHSLEKPDQRRQPPGLTHRPDLARARRQPAESRSD